MKRRQTRVASILPPDVTTDEAETIMVKPRGFRAVPRSVSDLRDRWRDAPHALTAIDLALQGKEVVLEVAGEILELGPVS